MENKGSAVNARRRESERERGKRRLCPCLLQFSSPENCPFPQWTQQTLAPAKGRKAQHISLLYISKIQHLVSENLKKLHQKMFNSQIRGPISQFGQILLLVLPIPGFSQHGLRTNMIKLHIFSPKQKQNTNPRQESLGKNILQLHLYPGPFTQAHSPLF